MKLKLVLLVVLLTATSLVAQKKPAPKTLSLKIPPISSDKSIRYDYDIVYVRAPRFMGEKPGRWAEVFNPFNVDPGCDLMLLHPDGSEEVLVKGGKGAVADPYVSFDGQWIYFARFHDQTNPAPWGFPRGGSDIYKIHVKTRKLVRLTHQERTPNTGILSEEKAKDFPVFNLGPCPAPGGKVVFTSSRNLLEAPKEYTRGTMQLFVMDNDGSNVEMIGHFNLGSALHPVILRDGRVMFSSYESQGMRDLRNWGLWYVYPDGTGWGPIVSSFQQADVYHFHTQLGDGSLVFEAYYNLNNFGFGTLYRMPNRPKKGYAAFGPGLRSDSRNYQHANTRFSFAPHGVKVITPFVSSFDSPARLSNPEDPQSPRVGKFTHPAGAPGSHLLAVWSPGSVNSNGSYRKYRKPLPNSGIYLIKNGASISEPAQMLMIKNDPKYNEQWPRAVVPYKRIYGVDQPKLKNPLKNDGTASPHLDEGSPFGLIGTSSLYKRESFPGGMVPEGSVTAKAAKDHYTSKLKGLRQFNSHWPFHDSWTTQGSDCGLYDNEDIHAIRILAQEPTTQRSRKFWNWGAERYRILGEIPVRHFSKGKQPLDPDGNPDTSFLAKIPADTSFTFQMLDREGMMLTMAQTWHQVRPGEVRHDCGGCHAHSQKPTPFEKTAAARRDYRVFDLTEQTPLLTSKKLDESKRQWSTDNNSGLRYEKKPVVNVEFYRDIVPIFKRSCVACHSKDKPETNHKLVLDDLEMVPVQPGGGMFRGVPGGKVPATFAMLAMGKTDRYGHTHVRGGWQTPQVSRYVRTYQARRSLLAWKILGRRTDGWSNEDFPTATTPGDAKTLQMGGKPVDATNQKNLIVADVDYVGSVMPPPEAVQAGKVQALTDEDRRTLFRWIDLGCPIDLKGNSTKGGSGWMDDEIRPTLTLGLPGITEGKPLSRILVGAHDAFTGLDLESFRVIADFPVDSLKAGENLASKFTKTHPGVWELRLKKPIQRRASASLEVSIRDRQGNLTRWKRSFSIGTSSSP